MNHEIAMCAKVWMPSCLIFDLSPPNSTTFAVGRRDAVRCWRLQRDRAVGGAREGEEEGRVFTTEAHAMQFLTQPLFWWCSCATFTNNPHAMQFLTQLLILMV